MVVLYKSHTESQSLAWVQDFVSAELALLLASNGITHLPEAFDMGLPARSGNHTLPVNENAPTGIANHASMERTVSPVDRNKDGSNLLIAHAQPR